MKNENTILITGASGFIGYNACEYYKKKGWRVVGLANDGNVPKDVKLVSVNLLNFDELKQAINKIKPSVILHLGAYVVLDRDFEVANKCIDVNIKGTLNLLEAIKDSSLKRFLFFSTEEVYGKNKPPFKETQLPYPPSPYAVSKVAGENLCLMYHNLYKVPTTIFRIATIFGYHQPKTRFIPNMMLKSIENEPLLLNSGKNKRDYLFVEELLDAIDKSINNKKAEGEIFNIGHKNSIPARVLAEKIIKISGSKSKLRLNAFPDRENEAPDWKMDCSKAEKILGWKLKQSIEKGLEKSINFYKQHKV